VRDAKVLSNVISVFPEDFQENSKAYPKFFLCRIRCIEFLLLFLNLGFREGKFPNYESWEGQAMVKLESRLGPTCDPCTSERIHREHV